MKSYITSSFAPIFAGVFGIVKAVKGNAPSQLHGLKMVLSREEREATKAAKGVVPRLDL